ncbi:hypothetical protein HYDPIDRAFT_107202 [Hydnomerulius pinastri MD-312]|nr:hypothetical protein HYDPIDRAFT_107202 [Hydnomerulius pinastri MD-312]
MLSFLKSVNPVSKAKTPSSVEKPISDDDAAAVLIADISIEPTSEPTMAEAAVELPPSPAVQEPKRTAPVLHRHLVSLA